MFTRGELAVSSGSEVLVRRIGGRPLRVNSCSVTAQDRVADKLARNPTGRNGRGGDAQGIVMSVAFAGGKLSFTQN